MAGFDHKPGQRLGGGSKKEATREELLEKVRLERAARADQKKKSVCVICIQRHWRGYAVRKALHVQLLDSFSQHYSSLVTQPKQQLEGQLLHDLVPQTLALLLPAGSNIRAKALREGAPLSFFPAQQASLATGRQQPTQQNSRLLKVVRTSLALLIRTCSSGEVQSSFLAMAVSPNPKNRTAWQQQAPMLLHLCCCLVSMGGSTSGDDAVVDAAAVRIIGILTDACQWKFASEDGLKVAAASSLLQTLIKTPMPLFAAMSRSLPAAAVPATPSATPSATNPPTAASKQAAHAQKLLPVVLHVLQAGLQGSGAGGASATACITSFVSSVLLSQGACEVLSKEIQDQLRSPQVMDLLCSALVQCANTQGTVRGLDNLWGLANLTQLVLLPLVSDLEGGAKPPNLSPRTAVAYLRAASALLPVAVAAVGPKPTADCCKAAARLWPLSRRGVVLALLQAVEGTNGGVEQFVNFCQLAVHHLQLLYSSLVKMGLPASDVPILLNTLAFDPTLLPRLWNWACHSIGLPKEAPLSATRGLDVVTLAQGFRCLSPEHSQALSLFCKVYNHLLFVLDDEEFYEGTAPFSLAQARAIVTSLNCLVFHTYLPKASDAALPPPPGGSVSLEGGLAESAPQLLRTLYERDVRRNFCQPVIWVAPYNEMFGVQKKTWSSSFFFTGPRNVQGLPSSQGGSGSAPSTSNTMSDSLHHAASALGIALPGGSEEEDAAAHNAGNTTIAGFYTASVLHALFFNSNDGMMADYDVGLERGAHGGMLNAKAGEGRRPASVASLLRLAPQAIPFDRRVDLWRTLLDEDKRRGRYNKPPYEGGVPPIKLTVHRRDLMEDAFRGLAGSGSALKARLIVTFINEIGLSEAGLDYGGLMKELLEEVVVRGFNADYGLFTTTVDGFVYPRPSADKVDSGLQLLEFLGLMVGKALYEGILLNVAFAPFFVTRLQGRTPMFDDLRTLDPELHRSLMQVKRYNGDVQDLGLDFTVEDTFFGQTTAHELLPGRGSQPVTNENRLLYCHLLADWHLNVKLGRPAEAFARGLSHLIPPSSLRLFNPKELNELISGGNENGGIDVDDMKAWVQYSGGYSQNSSAIQLFWKVVDDLSAKELGQLLKFVTSSSRAPLGGFRYLQPPFTIHKVDCDASLLAMIGGKDVDRLPSASTCYNLLKLPNYRRGATMKQKMLYAITSGAGFELS